MADPAMVDRYLQSRGAAPSAENANRVRQHFAANPDNLDRRALGLPGGLDDNSGVLDAMLDKLIADTSATPAAPVATAPQTQGDANPAPAPSRRGPVASPRQGAYPAPNEAAGTPNNVRAPASNTTVSGMVDESGMPVANVASGGDDGGILKWLLPILGISAAVPAAENMRGRMPSGPMSLPTDPNSPLLAPPQQRIGSQVGPNMESVGSEMETIDQRNQAGRTQQRAQVQQSVDAENDAMLRQMEETERARRKQKGADATVSAAKRLLRR
jgi:hypothetical protein